MTTYTHEYEAAPPRRRRRWGRRLLIVFIVLLVILGGLLVVADRVAASVAERTISDEIAKELVAQDIKSSPPEVSVGGFPFLTQVLSGEYQSIKISLRDLEGNVEGDGVRVPRLDVDARDVSAPLDTLRSGQGEVVAQTLDGTATISYASVVDLMDQPGLRLSERDGKLVVDAQLDVAGQRVDLSGTADLSIANGRVQIRVRDLQAEGVSQLPGVQALVNQFARQISISIALPELPFKLDVRGVQARPDGLAVDAQALDVALNQW
ncbi:DUF2993 domain-containing protein [Phytohabitans sp. ZYX-F-186]|uniref:DUF2993 domain-containing protein n=1 Tax=Phytohabitans maris TaxID=3071409 RepID=A0ABU0ZHZ4_9ACTN|nr:DUF2993 domain-containing protein [Phytohabitans sp. ZYX-F-186]MDQ7906675.1 DUF2993 domain-containing protein [Phytohabitans sp. ZYX-F-186]